MIKTVTIFDNGVRRTWDGELIAQTRSNGPLRWAEFYLYVLPAGGFVVHRVGASRVYHTKDTRCVLSSGGQMGEPSSLDELPDDAEPCWNCKPPSPLLLPDGAVVRFEQKRHTVRECEDPEDVVKTLISYREGNRRVTRMSGPVRELLRQAARSVPEFAGIQPEQRIGA